MPSEFEARLETAWQRRAALHGDPHTTAYRLINGAGDGFPDVVVDRFGPALVAHLYTQGRRVEPPSRLLRALAERAGAAAIYIKYRPSQASVVDEASRRALAPARPLWGEPLDEVEAQENRLRFLIRPGEGLSTGLFLDMRRTRAWVNQHAARMPGGTVLNCFAYTCGFGVAALAGGAERAANLDLSRRYLEWGKRNTALNGHQPPETDFIFGDVFDWLRRFARAGQQFGLVILDPPSFATTRRTRFAAERDYADLAALAAPLVAPGGSLLACVNTHTLPERAFVGQVRRGLEGHRAQIARTTHEPEADFPRPAGEPPYLKVCEVVFEG